METLEVTAAADATRKPGYKHTRFGWIPEEWEVTKLKKCCSLIKDGTHFSPTSKEGPWKYITSKNIRKGYLDLSDLSHISDEEHKAIYARCPVQKGDVLLTKDGASTGNVCLNPLEEEFSLLSSVAVIRADSNKVLNTYLLHFLLSPFGEKVIDDEIAGQAITRITLDKIQAIQLPLPSLEEQKAIAGILDKMDESIRQASDLLTAKRTYKRGLMQQLLTGQRRFSEFQGQPWREVKLGEVFERVQRPYRAGVEAILSISAKKGFVHQSEKFSRVVAGDTLKRYTLLQRGEFSYNKGNSDLYPCGCIYRLEEHEEAAVPNVYISFRNSAPEQVDSNFYQHYFLNRMLDAQLTRKINSGVRNDGLLNLNPEDFFEVMIQLPPLPEQQRIAAVLTACDQEIELLQAQLEQWQQQKKGLMQQLLTGQLRVPAA